jgi:hypothetical protein
MKYRLSTGFPENSLRIVEGYFALADVLALNYVIHIR